MVVPAASVINPQSAKYCKLNNVLAAFAAEVAEVAALVAEVDAELAELAALLADVAACCA